MVVLRACLQELGRAACVFVLATILIYGMLVASPRGVEVLSRGHPEDFSVAGGYLRWLGNLALHQDLGTSKIWGRQPVLGLVLSRGRNTLFMVGLALAVSGASWAFFGGLQRRAGHIPLVAVGSAALPYVLSAFPAFVIGRFLTQMCPELIYSEAKSIWVCYLVPGAVLGIADGFLCEMIRHGEEELAAIRDEGYMLLARAKGASMWRHLRYQLGLNLSQLVLSKVTLLVSGTVILEYIFKLPGVGGLVLEAANKLDVDLLLGTLVILVSVVIAFNTVNRFLRVAVDPRLR